MLRWIAGGIESSSRACARLAMKGLAMTSYQASLWREMAKEAGAAADRVQDPGVRREMWSMAARYMAMAERVEVWAAAERSAIEPDEAN